MLLKVTSSQVEALFELIKGLIKDITGAPSVDEVNLLVFLIYIFGSLDSFINICSSLMSLGRGVHYFLTLIIAKTNCTRDRLQTVLNVMTFC